MTDAPKAGVFSGLSLGRGRAATPRTSSELVAHPLLGASSSSLSLPIADAGTDDSQPSRSPERGLPYKPRQRPASAAAPPVEPATTSAAAATMPTATTSSEDSATATSRLQMQSLKAAAQRIGLGNGSMGMGMIDSVFDKGARVRAEGGEWADLLKVLTSGKAVLLLPVTPASSLPITPQILKDHIAFVSPPIANTTSGVSVVVTLSGLMGTLLGGTITFESSAPTDSPMNVALRDDGRRVTVLSSLRPTQLHSNVGFPSFNLSTEATSLSFPPLGKGVPIERRDKDPPRRMNAFMSLFGSQAPSQPTSRGTLSPERPASPSPVGSQIPSPRPSIISLEQVDSNSSDYGEGYNVTAFTISRPVRYTEVHKTLVKAVRSAVRAELDGLPERVVDKVLRLVVSSVCPISGSATDQALLKSHHHGFSSADSDGVPLDFGDPNACGERLQDFMEAVFDDLVKYYRSDKRPSKPGDQEVSELHIETEASDGTERVEALVCRLLYNRIFSPLKSDDARHDEALASRIAALNLLDLSLDHLGLVTHPPHEAESGALAKGLATLVEKIGQEFQKLSHLDSLTPRDKTELLVKAHKVAIDGLNQLPPVGLRPEGEAYRPEEATTSASAAAALSPIVEMTETPMERRPSQAQMPAVSLPSAALGGNAPPPTDDLADSVSTVVPAQSVEPEGTEFVSTAVPVPSAGPQDVQPTDETQPNGAGATSGADLILPLIIFAVVKANPPQLASQLLYLRRYRSAICLSGEASYAIVNLTAVVEFLEHVQLSELGLGDASQVISVEDLSPIGLTYLDESEETASIASASSRLRARAFQVGELAGSAAGSANKVITGVVDSLSSLRGYISPAPEPDSGSKPTSRPRQASTFSLASVTASVANIAAAASTAAARTRSRASSTSEAWPADRELVEVASRPGSIRPTTYEADSDAESTNEEYARPISNESPPLDDDELGRTRSRSDARSIMSVSSMMQQRDSSRERGPSISGRLASIGTFGRPGATPSNEISSGASTPPEAKGFFASLTRAPVRRPSTLALNSQKSPTTQYSALPDNDPPIERFMTCDVGDIRLNEIGVLLRDYRRLANTLARLHSERS